MSELPQLKKELASLADKQQAEISMRFFKTGKGQYGEGDKFLGVKMPVQRKLVKKYFERLNLGEIEKLLQSKIHEHRMTALLCLEAKFSSAKKEGEKKQFFDFYLKNISCVDNWDLVDVTCHKIVGEFLLDKPRGVLLKLARSKNLWERRISIVSTYAFIRKNQFDDTLKISKIMLQDKHDLIHKATGWMLREVGKRDMEKEKEFLIGCYREMPRTALRYAIERFPKNLRSKYMQGEV